MILKLILRAGLILLSCLLPFIGTAQTEIDSLLLRVEANCYDDLEQTLHFVELLEKKTTIKNNPSKWSKALLYKAVSAKYFGQMEKVLADLQQALDVAKQIQNDAVCRERMLEIQNEIGDYHLKMGNLDVAFLVFDQTIEKLRTRESLTKTEYQHLIISYLFAGKIKQQKKEYEAAITFYEYAIDYEKEKAAKNNRKASYGSTLGRLAQVYKEQGNYVLAIEHFKPCIKNYASIIKRDSAYFTYLASYVINNYHGLSECYLALNQPDSTLYYLNKSLAYPIPNKRYAALHNLLAGQAKVQQRQYHKADIYFQRAIDAIQHYYQDKKHAEVAAMYLSIGKSYQTAQKHKKALANYQLAIVNSVYNFDTLAVQANPKLRDIIAPQQLLASLHKKMDILYKEGKNTNDPTKLRLAWTTGTLATNLLDTITKESFFTEVDLMASISNQYSLFEIMIDIGYRLGLATWSESFALMEKSKSVALLKAFQKNKLPNLASSKKGTLDTMYQLKSAIAKEAALLYTTKNETSEDTLKILRIKNRLFEKQLAKRALQKRLLPLSYKGETTAHSLCVDSIKARLPNQQGLIEYFWGEQYLFAFIITPKHYALEKFSLTEDIKAYTKTLKEDLFYKRDAEYIRKANYLYQQILQPLLKYDELPEQLVIIPDGPLYYLPFELLLTDNPTNRKFQDFPYLLKQHAISYCFSSKAFFQLKAKRHRKQPKSKILAVAPSFYKVNRLKNTLYASRDLLDTLYHNTAEVETISTKISCDQLVSKKASKANFIAEVGDYRIIHLATHGKVDDLNPNFSFVAFSNTIDTLKFPYRLYINEINTLSLNADMVVLSACETGLGQIYQGEGILGCSRSFLSIGAKSIITTLWNINDRQTANLMDQFYTQLQQEGLGKAQALRQAKLAYLEASDDFYAHPKYWAAFMAYGDMSAISTHLKPAFNPDVLIFTGLGLALVGLLVSFCIWKRIKRQVG